MTRRTPTPNFIPIGRWESDEKSGEPKTWGVLGPQGGEQGVRLQNRKKCPWAIIRRTRIPNFIPIGRWKSGEKSGKPKTEGVLGGF